MASKCHGGQCSSCSLCKKSNPRYTHPITMKEKQREGYTLLKHLKPDIGETECICAPCAKQLCRNVSNPKFHPRWLPKSSRATEGTTMTERHEKWLSNIRRTVWQRADSESHNMPSTEALKLHWKRTVWIVAMWHSSTANELDLPRKLLTLWLPRFCKYYFCL